MATNRQHIDRSNASAPVSRKRTYSGRPQRLSSPIYIARGVTSDAIPLLKHHYLPYLPASTRATFRAMDKRTGQIVGVLLLGYPTLRSHKRESVYGHLPPHQLNRRFTQLQRLIVRPTCGHTGIAHELLHRAILECPTRFLDALNRSTVPTRLFTDAGFTLSPGEPANYYHIDTHHKPRRVRPSHR